jgi:hypothetical protein
MTPNDVRKLALSLPEEQAHFDKPSFRGRRPTRAHRRSDAGATHEPRYPHPVPLPGGEGRLAVRGGRVGQGG